MKFTDKRTSITIPFRTIKEGECFITSSDNHINMKMHIDVYYDDACIVVDLITGKQYCFENDDERVVAVNAEIIITN